MKVVNDRDLIKSYLKPDNTNKLVPKNSVKGSANLKVKSELKSDVVELSPVAREISKLREMARSLPEERLEKVEQVRAMIENGTYKIEPEKIAEKMIKHAIDILA